MSNIRDLKAAIETWRAEQDNHRDHCTSSEWSGGTMWDCTGDHQDTCDELEAGIRNTALALAGKPRSNASEITRAAYGYRDAWNAWETIDEAHKEHHRRYRDVRNFLHLDLGECNKCDETLDLWEDEHEKLVTAALSEFEYLY